MPQTWGPRAGRGEHGFTHSLGTMMIIQIRAPKKGEAESSRTPHKLIERAMTCVPKREAVEATHATTQ